MAIFDSGGVQIYYQEHGAGEPVVMVHGFASHSDNNWGPMWFTFLAPHFRVIAIDCRGHGKSGKPHDAAAYGAEKMGDDVIRLLDHLKIQRALLMGYSMGGRISMGLLGNHPERFRAVVLGGIGAGIALNDPARRKGIADALLADDDSAVKNEMAKQFRDFAKSVGNDLKALGAVMSGASLALDLGKFASNKVPVLIVIGTKDELVGSAEPLQKAIAGSRLLRLEGRDHLSAPSDKRYMEEALRFFQQAPK